MAHTFLQLESNGFIQETIGGLNREYS
jgi:hypothetical protein